MIVRSSKGILLTFMGVSQAWQALIGDIKPSQGYIKVSSTLLHPQMCTF